MKNKAFTLVELFIVIAIIGILLALIVGGGCSRSDGVRVGVLQKLSHNGLMSKSWEGQLLLGGIVDSGNGAAANVWEFSTLDNTMATNTMKLLGQRVKITYHHTVFYNPFRRDTTYTVVVIEPAE